MKTIDNWEMPLDRGKKSLFKVVKRRFALMIIPFVVLIFFALAVQLLLNIEMLGR